MKTKFVSGELYVIKSDWVIFIDYAKPRAFMTRTRILDRGAILLFLDFVYDGDERTALRFVYESTIYWYERLGYANADFKQVNRYTEFDDASKKLVRNTKKQFKEKFKSAPYTVTQNNVELCAKE